MVGEGSNSGPGSRSWGQGWGRWWPNRCAVCRIDTRGLQARVCGECISRFAPPEPRCRLCALPLAGPASVCGRCLREPPPWSRAVAACDYGYPWDGLLTALKFGDAIDLAQPLADLLARAVLNDPATERPHGHAAKGDDGAVAANPPAPETEGADAAMGRLAAPRSRAHRADPIDVLLPTPLSDTRLAERGYNQAALLARRLGRRLGLPVEDGWLLRIDHRERQTALPREERLRNLRGAFAVEPLALARLRGRRLALVDDVMTTGATLAEASLTLSAAGAASVEVWVVGRTPG